MTASTGATRRRAFISARARTRVSLPLRGSMPPTARMSGRSAAPDLLAQRAPP